MTSPAVIEGVDAALEVLRTTIGGCREETEPTGEPGSGKCWAPADYVLWGKLIPVGGLGPRCYDHAVGHVGHHALASNSGYALVNLRDAARALTLHWKGERP